ncbi:MAG: alpha/beta hydrolase [Cyclobacteriaceae bacterium]
MKIFRRLLTIVILAIVGFLYLSYQKEIPVEELVAQYGQAPSQYMEIDGMPLHYRVEGEGMPLVLIHGTGASLHTWEVWTEELSSDFKVIRFDLPAFGLTGPSPKGEYSLDFYADFVDKVLTNLDIDSCYIAGNSLGGAISWYYATQHPDKVKKLVLVDASGHPRVNGQPTIFKLAQQPAFAALFNSFTPKFIIENNLKAVYHDDSKITDELVDRYYRMALREGNRQAFIDRANTKFTTRSELIETIDVPTLILWGENDTWVPLSDAYLFKEEIEGSKLIIYEGVGHVPMEEIPIKTARDTKAFLLR